jgi:hypothetical protein
MPDHFIDFKFVANDGVLLVLSDELFDLVICHQYHQYNVIPVPLNRKTREVYQELLKALNNAPRGLNIHIKVSNESETSFHHGDINPRYGLKIGMCKTFIERIKKVNVLGTHFQKCCLSNDEQTNFLANGNRRKEKYLRILNSEFESCEKYIKLQFRVNRR